MAKFIFQSLSPDCLDPVSSFQNDSSKESNDSKSLIFTTQNGTEKFENTTTKQAPSPVSDIESVFINLTNVILTWKHNDTTASDYQYNLTGLCPATSYTFSIVPGIPSPVWGDPMYKNVTTEPLPVSNLRVAFMGRAHAVLTWSNDNGTESCRVFLQSTSNHSELVQDLAVNISGLKPGFRHVVRILPKLNKTLLDTEGGKDANNTERSPEVSPEELGKESLDTEVQLFGLAPDTQYVATVYSQAADGTEGQPQAISFLTNSGQIFDIQVVVISATNMTLIWKDKYNGSSSDYMYKVHVAGGTDSLNFNVSQKYLIIPGLHSSTLYNVTVCPFLKDVKGVPGFLQVYTPPGPVSHLQVTLVRTREIGLAWNSSDSEFFRVVTTQEGTRKHQENVTTNHMIIIDNLKPGTSYRFEIFPLGPNGTEGPSQEVTSRTDSSAVYDIHVVSVTNTEMQLEWQNRDNASEYIYHLVIKSQYGSRKTNSSEKSILLKGLTPGTLYNVTITPEIDQVQGDMGSIAHYTQPSNVSYIVVEPNTTAAVFRWNNMDASAAAYSYRLVITRSENTSNITQEIKDIGVTFVVVTELTPGSPYTVEIFAQVEDGLESVPTLESFCTDPAPVTSFHCEMVPKEPALVLRWACPPGANAGFELGVSSGAWENATLVESCVSENGTECSAEVTYLNFSTSYNISIATLSCEKMAPPAQDTCTTGITDPPPPDGSPNITSISHNSVKVKFSGFEASHGPIKAYAVILTTGEAGHPSTDVLKYTYEDFKKGASDTYVTYLIRTEEKGHSQGLSQVLKYEIDVGNESTTLGYYNGKLEPLGSYRACVAGFTNITFHRQNDGLINGAESYVSFSRYSEAVFLPQDPGVICGAVFGCIFGAMVIVAVGGFIFWRKKRKDAKNNEVSFSQIKPKKSKLIRVENFEAYFKKQQADSNCGFAEEYEDLKLVGISLPKYAAELAENRGKNRYNNVLPYDISRVKLSVQTHSTDDYINANYMPGYHSKRDFIATQGPLPNTLKDFWRMVWEKNVYAIVMLTKCVEQGRTKCEEYWPSKQAQDYGDITVTMTTEVVLPEWTIRDFTVKNIQTSETHLLRQFHFTSWPDHGVPDTTDLLINFRYLVRDYMKQSSPESPILVHCSAGVGRTGTFMAIDRLIYQIENENTVDVYGIVYDLRMHRPLMVQTEDQYVFLNQCVLDIIRAQKDSKVDLIYQNTTAMTIYENLEPVSMFGKSNGYIT
ncbi:receptor-type tyrosine-protein phosphatase eta [Perognathus longimembris pacificus]|uniref:receptor-type tyrosine-protein phosphatase eta n=1 Tax=Perognathus longimembris pacificus TaxID=214514 RepID=UPI0020191C49|nr:receptor-type tyrosine-protein phosphatase eta [Perognathus longimembris pacificus]